MLKTVRTPAPIILLAAAALLGALILAPGTRASNEILHPDDYFGRRVGAPGVLIPHAAILEYYRTLAEQTDRVQIRVLGETTMGRPFYYALVSSPENLANIDALLADNDKLYDPRGVSEQEAERIISEGKTFVIVNGQIHATEVGASQGSILLAHRLASSDDDDVMRILDNVVLAHVPVHNPDGQEMVTEWLDDQRGTDYENSPPPFLYQEYTGHDNNRDWYMFTQQETRLSIEMQNLFHPQFTLDQHQQGSNGSRIFVPPFEDPWEPNVDSALIASNNMIGTFMGQYLTARGYSGVEWKQRYDAWTPARAYYHTHGGVRILTEVASASYADDVEIPFERISDDHQQRHWYFPMPWMGGTWSFATVVDYHYASAMAALRAAADLRPHLLRGMWAAQRRSVQPPVGGPTAFVVSADQADPPATAAMLEVLRIADVELHRAESPFVADGREFPAGSVVVPFAQPAGRFAKSVLERQEYPQLYLYEGGPLDPPYDVTAHTLPLLMNVDVAAVGEDFSVPLARVEGPLRAPGQLVGANAAAAEVYLLDPRATRSYSVAAALGGDGLQRAARAFRAAGREWPAGTWIVRIQAGASGVTQRQRLIEAVTQQGVDATGVMEVPEVEVGWVGPPRVGIYRSYVPSMPEGWLRYVLDTHAIPFNGLRDADIRGGDLAPYSVIFLPPGSLNGIVEGLSSTPREGPGRRRPASPPEFAGGIGDEGVAALRRYVEEGGVLFTWAGSTEVATQHLGGPASLNSGLSRTEFNIPGSLLRAEVDTEHWLGYGLQPNTAVFYWNSPFWEADGAGYETVARFPVDDLLASGWIQGEETLAGSAALISLPYGSGRVVMVGFSPEYRAQAHATFKVMFNAIFRPRPEARP